MARTKMRAATLGGTADDVEAAFYEALQQGDIEKLMACWADEDDIVCIHPGGGRLHGPRSIRAAFEALFANGVIHARPEQVRKVDAMGSTVHSLIERVAVMTPEGPRDAWVVATNIYHKTAQGWRLVAHHASPGSVDELPDGGVVPPVLH
jgi:ketosteroid isomerase-like protein